MINSFTNQSKQVEYLSIQRSPLVLTSTGVGSAKVVGGQGGSAIASV